MFFFSPRIDQHLRRSEELADDGRLEEALAVAEEAVRLAPRNAEGHAHRASLLAALGREDEAVTAFEKALQRDGKNTEALLGLSDLLLEGGEEECEKVVALCQRGGRISRRSGDSRLSADFLLLEGMAWNALGEPRGALERFDQALAILGPDSDLVFERAITLFELARFDEARSQFELIVAQTAAGSAAQEDAPDPASAEEPGITCATHEQAAAAGARHYLGLLAERQGDDEEASKWFAEARRLSPETYIEPITLGEEEFDQVVEAALARLPHQVRRYLSNVAIAVEPFPSEDELASGALSPTILGVFRGSPLAEKASWDPWAHFPSSIVLYQRNLERFARDREELIEEIDVTLLHEVGHFLGFDEEDLRERGLD